MKRVCDHAADVLREKGISELRHNDPVLSEIASRAGVRGTSTKSAEVQLLSLLASTPGPFVSERVKAGRVVRVFRLPAPKRKEPARRLC